MVVLRERMHIGSSASRVDAYVADPMCGFNITSSAMLDFFNGLLYVTASDCGSRTPSDLPILLISGSDDPAGGEGRMVKRCRDAYEQGGVNQVEMKLYDGMRHEILNEIGREQVFRDVLVWLDGFVMSD